MAKSPEIVFFEFMYEKYFPALRYYAFRILNDKEEAEDIVEDSYIKVLDNRVIEINWENAGREKIVKSWLYTTIRNASLNHLKQQFSRQSKIAEIAQKYYQDIPSHEHLMIKAETIRIAKEWMDVLPTECRKIFDSLYINGNTVRETSNDSGLSISTIKNQKARGLEIIRKKKNIKLAI